MPGLNLLSFIPADFQQQMFNQLIDFLSEQAGKVLGDEVGTRLKGLRSDAAFIRQFEAGLKRAADRFVKEYEAEDEDLTAAIADDPTFFKNEEIQVALLWMLKHPGTDLDRQREAVAQSFATVLPARKKRARVDQAVLYFLKCLTEELWHLPELQPIYSLQFQRMTAEATRQQVELQKAQLHAQLELNSGLREALLQLTDAIGERKLLAAGDTPSILGPQVFHNLPQPDHGRFVGREDEVKQIIRILRPYPHSQYPLVTIDGIGGIGKSALALEVAHRYLRNYAQIPPEERFDAVIWTSAKQNVLTAEGIVPRQQALRTLDDIYTAIAITLQREGITRVRPEEQAETVRNALTRQRTLLIVDNLETVDDKAVMEFLRELPAPTKAIVTTRHRLDVAYPVRLTGMPWADAQLLIADECAKKNVSLSEDNQRRLYERTGGVPLAMTWSIAQMSFGHSVETVLTRLGQPNNDVARFCFEGAVKSITGQPAHLLLMALSLFTTDASRTALGYVTQLASLDRDDGFVVLEKMSLINKDGDRFGMLPLAQVYSYSELNQHPELANVYRTRWAEYLLDFAVNSRKLRRSFGEIRPELPNILSAIDWRWHSSDVVEMFAAVYIVTLHLRDMGDWKTSSHYIEMVLQAAEQAGRDIWLAHFARRLASIKEYQGDLLETVRLARTAAEIYRKNIKDNGECWRWLLWSVYRLSSVNTTLGNMTAAREYALEGMDIIQRLPKDGNEDVIMIMLCQMANVCINEGNYEVAKGYLVEARAFSDAHAISVDELWAISYMHRLFGMVALKQGDYPTAKAYYYEGLDRSKTSAGLQELADAYQDVATLEETLGHPDLARQAAHEAMTRFENLGMKLSFVRMRDLLKRLDT